MNSLHIFKIIFFSYFGLDFCFDYSFWNDPNKCYNGTGTDKYSHARLCFAYDKSNSIADHCSNSIMYKAFLSSSLLSHVAKYCPNSSNESECKDPNFYCNFSKSCIEDIKKCDGIKHCFYGEDEGIDTCHSAFPESATVECIEPNQPFDDILIKAVRCNGITECKNGEDEPEECEGFKVSTSHFILKILIGR